MLRGCDAPRRHYSPAPFLLLRSLPLPRPLASPLVPHPSLPLRPPTHPLSPARLHSLPPRKVVEAWERAQAQTEMQLRPTALQARPRPQLMLCSSYFSVELHLLYAYSACIVALSPAGRPSLTMSASLQLQLPAAAASPPQLVDASTVKLYSFVMATRDLLHLRRCGLRAVAPLSAVRPPPASRLGLFRARSLDQGTGCSSSEEQIRRSHLDVQTALSLLFLLRSLTHTHTHTHHTSNVLHTHNLHPITTMASAAIARRSTIHNVMRHVAHHTACPCHACSTANGLADVNSAARALMSKGRARSYAKPVNEGSTEYAYEVSAANLRFGEGATVSGMGAGR